MQERVKFTKVCNCAKCSFLDKGKNDHFGANMGRVNLNLYGNKFYQGGNKDNKNQKSWPNERSSEGKYFFIGVHRRNKERGPGHPQ